MPDLAFGLAAGDLAVAAGFSGFSLACALAWASVDIPPASNAKARSAALMMCREQTRCAPSSPREDVVISVCTSLASALKVDDVSIGPVSNIRRISFVGQSTNCFGVAAVLTCRDFQRVRCGL